MTSRRPVNSALDMFFHARAHLHGFLYKRIPVVLVVCLLLIIVTFTFAPLAKVFLAIAIVVGMIDSLVSMEELTGGTKLSWLSVSVIIVGDVFANALSSEATTSFQSIVLNLQFVAWVFFTESVIIGLLRSRLERFCAERNLK